MRAALPLLITVLIGLAGCGDPGARAPFTDSRIPPGLELRFYPPQGWAWGLIQVGEAPPVRYGVAAPASRPLGQIIILPTRDETAEAWFETVRDLVAHGYVVWVLEGSGQGGSGRSALPRDMVHASSLDLDVAAVMMLAAKVARDRPRFLLADGTSGPVAARAAELGLGLDGLVLVGSGLGGKAPMLSEDPTVARMHMLGLGAFRPPGGHGWRRGPEMEHLKVAPDQAKRLWLTRQWQTANPNLRMGSPSASWIHAFNAQFNAANAGWAHVKTRTLLVGSGACGGLTDCRLAPLADEAAHPEKAHPAFIDMVLAFTDPSGAALARTPAPVTLNDQS